MGDLFLACKRGDFDRVKHLVEEMECDVNVTDKWDSTPLYYACLSGYEDIVEYLLQSGATVDDNFSGERCMNCALTEKIRSMLRNPPQRRPSQNSAFRDMMSFMLSNGQDMYSDICLIVGLEETHLYVHRVVLCKHSIYFSRCLRGPGRGKESIHFKHYKERSVLAWLQIMQFMYTQQLEIRQESYKDCLHLSRRLGMPQLTGQLKGIAQKLQKKQDEKYDIIMGCSTYPELAEIAIEQDRGRKQRQMFADLCCIVEGSRFYCHKSFLVANSPYFAALLNTEHFTEVTTSNRGNLTFITLNNIRSDLFALILQFIYSATTDINLNTLEPLLFYSDHYMIYGLKVACGTLLATQLDLTNAVQTLSLARLIRMSRLQHSALRFIAYNFENIQDKSALSQMLLVDELTNRGNRLVRVSESSLEEMEIDQQDESTEEDSVDIQLDLRMYFREQTNKLNHSPTAQLREERCVRDLHAMLHS